MQLPDTHNKQTGFSLIELLVTVAILTTLLTIALPTYQDFTIKAKYGSSVNTLGANKNALIYTAVQNGFSFSHIPEEELDEQEMYDHFSLSNTADRKYLAHIGGKKESDHDYMLYQFVDKEAMNAPEIAPEMVAMAVVISESGEFTYHCHYYHSDYEWDYSGGERYVSLECDDNTSRATGTTAEDNSEGESGSASSGDSSSGDSSSGDSSSGDSSSGGSSSGGSSSGGSSSGGSSSPESPASGSDSSSNDDTGEMCDHGGKVKNNNGHGNNSDGVDSSNPGKGNNKKTDESCTGSACVDDEKNRGRR